MRYNVRDLIGHWVKPRSRAGKMCPHACCRNRRVHPENFPVILPRELLRKASDRELVDHLVREVDSKQAARVAAQVDRELERRAAAERRRAAAPARRRAAASARSIERQELVENAVARAEQATNGYMVNKQGRARGVTAESLFTGSEARALRYATPELVEHWQRHPRPSAGLLSANPQVVRRARARSDIGRVEARTPYRDLY